MASFSLTRPSLAELIGLVGFLACLGVSLVTTETQVTTVSSVHNASLPQKVKLGLFYESRCPDSRRFYLRQLVPVYRELMNVIELEQVPFGHARILGPNKMVCQHGPRECAGNRLMACVQAHGTDESSVVATIGCIFEGHKTLKDCLEKNMPKAQFDTIDKCKDSEESFKMMEKFEKLTGSVDYVPHVEIDDQHSEEIQTECEIDLKRCICKRYRGSDKPETCKEELTTKTPTAEAVF